MAPRSQNGLTANDRSVIRTRTIPGTDVSVPLRIGPVGDLLTLAAARWHREVEPIRAPDGVLDCWGYAERTIRGSTTVLSNHASGSAIDIRARAHPLGVPKERTFTSAQIAAVHRIVDDLAPVLRWGGDYDDPARGGVPGSRPDPMHLETVGTEAQCAEVLARFARRFAPTTPVTTEGDEMAAIVLTLPAGTLQRQPIGVPPFRGEARFYLSTGWTPAKIRAGYFVRDRGPGKTPEQERWGGFGSFDLVPDDRPSWSLPEGCTQISLEYDAQHPLAVVLTYQPA